MDLAKLDAVLEACDSLDSRLNWRIDRYADSEWEENKHPRDKEGQFASVGSKGPDTTNKSGTSNEMSTYLPTLDVRRKSSTEAEKKEEWALFRANWKYLQQTGKGQTRYTLTEQRADAPQSEVPLDQVVATQTFLNYDKVNRYLTSNKGVPPLVRKFRDKYYIQDGHHRVVAALQNGDKSMTMHVLDLSKFDHDVDPELPEWMKRADSFDESKHPRGQPENAGQFAETAKLSISEGKVSGGVELTYDIGSKSYTGSGISAERIKSLAIPPGWHDVRISTDPEADLQVLGKDSKSRSVRRYSAKFCQSQTARKFERVGQLNAKRRNIEAATVDGIRKGRDSAAAVRLMYLTGMRPGGDEDTQAATKAYGATTLLKDQVKVDNRTVNYDFIGKKGVRIQGSVDDPLLAHYIDRRLKAKDGDRLFRTSAEMANKIVKSAAGPHFKAKDLRTLKANALAAQIVATLSPKTPKEAKRAVKEVATVVSKQLGNTPAVALSAYINPMIFASWGV